MREVVVGVDIGGTNTVFGVITESGEILGRSSISTTCCEKFEDFVATASKEALDLVERVGECKLVAVGVGAPDANFFTGNIEHAANLMWDGVLPLAKLFEIGVKVPVSIANDANAAALGEKLFGGAKGCDNFVEITLGTGLGSGFVIAGNLLYGAGSFAGEVGHMQLIPDGRVCGCSRRGCAETYVSATGLVRTAVELMSELTIDSPLRELAVSQISSKKVYEFAKSGDTLALEAFSRTSEYLAQVLVDTVLFSNPEKIFLFGGLANSGELLMAPLKEAFERRSLKMLRGSCSLHLSKLPDSDAAILGAAALGWKNFRD
jgi:glucokinase